MGIFGPGNAFFGAAFLGYAVYRWSYPQAFAAGSSELDIVWGTINTVVLISSSLTMVLAVHSAQQGKRRSIVGWLVVTMMLSLIFLGIKSVEYAAKFEHHLFPGPHFAFDGPPQSELFWFLLSADRTARRTHDRRHGDYDSVDTSCLARQIYH
ncbi:MAG: cytochrome c oxidase subunit 3 [Myxococcota bacterium]